MGTIYQSLLQSSAFIKPNIPLSEKKIPKKVHGCLLGKIQQNKKTTKSQITAKKYLCFDRIFSEWQIMYIFVFHAIDSKIAIINMYNFMGKMLNNTIQCIH